MMTVERKLRRKAKMIAMTRNEPRMTASRTAWIDRSMKTAVSLVTDSRTPWTSLLIRSTSRLSAAETSTVFSPDCLLMLRRTPGLPLTRMMLRTSSLPSRMIAMSRM